MEDQAARLDSILPWARLTGELLVSMRPHEQHVHLRPSATGIRLVDLHPSRPQLDRGKIERSEGAAAKLRQLLDAVPGAPPGRPTPEKCLQSWLIAAAYRSAGKLAPLSNELTFVTDEQVFIQGNTKAVCDLLAIRRTKLGYAPAVIELKSKREMKRLVEQLTVAAHAIDSHRERFSSVFSAILARDVLLVDPCERWMVWPASEDAADPRTDELARQGIVVKGYRERKDGFSIF